MPELQVQRTLPLNSISKESREHFDLALHTAAAASAESMSELRRTVCKCVTNLKESDVDAVQMILTIKACAKSSALRYSPLGDEHPKSNVDLLLEQIVKWAIIQYYTDA